MSNVFAGVLVPGYVALACAFAWGCSQEPGSTATATDKRPSASAAAPKAGAPAKQPSVVAAPQKLGRSSAAKNQPGWPPVEFEPMEMRFGVLPPDGKGEGEATLFNAGTQPLIILRSIGSCSCIDAPKLDGRTIPPGGSLRFKTGMTMKSGLGEKHQRVVLLFEGYDDPVMYDLYAEVSMPVRFIPPYLAATASLSGTIEAVALDDRPFRILTANRKPPQFVGFDPATDSPRTKYTLKWDITDEVGAGAVPWFWVIETDREDCPVVDVRIQHGSTKPQRDDARPWEAGDQRVLIGNITANQAIEILTHVEYKSMAAPQPGSATVRSDSEQMDVELIEASAEGQVLNFRLRITPRQQQAGLFYEQLTISASGYSAPVSIIGRCAK